MATRYPSIDVINATSNSGSDIYKAIKAVSEHLASIDAVANGDFTAVIDAYNEAKDFTGITVVAGEEASWNPTTKVLTVPTIKGDKGDKGDRGLAGPKGDKGDKGSQGEVGPKGDTGEALELTKIEYNGEGSFTWYFSDGTVYVTPDLSGKKGDTGVSVHHVAPSSTTNPHGDFGKFSEIDTYTLWGDADETINLGSFVVGNGLDPTSGGAYGYMQRVTYDTDDSGVVDNSERLGGKSLEQIEEERRQAIQEAKISLGTSFVVDDIASRNSLINLTVGDRIHVNDDGDGHWSQYLVEATVDGTGSNSTFVKVMDEDTYLNANTKEAIKQVYESNPDTNAYTDAEKALLNVTTTLNTVANNVTSAINELKSRIDTVNIALGISNDTYTADSSTNYLGSSVSFKDADKKLDTAIKAETDRAINAEQFLQNQITSETARATNAEQSLQTRIDSEASRLDTEIVTRESNEGSLVDLATSNKTNLVSSINEVLSDLSIHTNDTSTHGVTEVVGTIETQTLVNKVINSATNTIGADHIHCLVRNDTGTVIPEGTIVVIDTSQSNNIVSIRPQASIHEPAIGITAETITTASEGLLIVLGTKNKLDTSSWIEGTLLYPDGSGGVTTTKPESVFYQIIGVVTKQDAVNGSIFTYFHEPTFIASLTQQGMVKLVDDLTTTSINDALTARQGKLLNDRLALVESHGTYQGDNVTITGDVVGATTVNADGSINLSVQVVDDSHNHVISNVDGLQTALDSKLDKAGGVITSDLTITGNLTVNGGSTVVNSTTVTTNDNVIVINNGEAGSGVTAGEAGIEVDRGIATNYKFVFDEASGSFRIGNINNTQPVATREDSPIVNGLAIWDTASNKFITTLNPSVTSLIVENGITVNGLVDGRNISVDGAKLDTIETNAKDDQVASEVPYTNTNSNLAASNVQSAIDTLDAIVDTHKIDYNNPHNVTKSQVGLGNVDNTSDINKPISVAQQTAFDNLQSELDTTQIGVGLGSDGTYTPSSTANYVATSTSVINAVNILDSQLKTEATNIINETTRATSAETILANRIEEVEASALAFSIALG